MWLLMTRVGQRLLSAEHRRILEEVQVSPLTYRSGFAPDIDVGFHTEGEALFGSQKVPQKG